jgi:hypothetical protein
MGEPILDARPALVSAAGGLIVLIAVLAKSNFTDVATWFIIIGALVAGAGAWWFRQRTLEPDRQLEEEKSQLLINREQLDREQRALDLYKSEVEEEALVLEKRRHKLSLQLAQTVGWWDLENPEAEVQDLPANDERERLVLAFCKEASERLFNKVIENGYVKDGVLDPDEIYKDVIHLFEGVAQVYQPDSDQPLLETSMEQVLRFLHNVSLQLLVQLEQLPVDVKGYNLRETYRFVKKAMDYYGMYKKVNPYWNYAKPAIFLGRFALGANPITLGLSWTITELASLGGKKISTRYTKKYGLRMFHEAIRIVGSETAAVYGANFREKDPDWVYATELIEMVHQFPPSRESLEAGLKEIGNLPLHSEYDRVYLFRCMANRFSAKPRNVRTREVMGMANGIQVAKQLEYFYELYYLREDPDRAQKWCRGLENRLGVKLQLAGTTTNVERPDELLAGFYSLASYLLGHKMLELDMAEKHLSASRIAAGMEGAALTKSLLQVRQAPPMVFDYPESLLTKEISDWFLQDLIDLQLEVFPRDADNTIIEEAASYFREKPGPWTDRIDERCRDLLLGQLDPEAPRPSLDCRASQALLASLGPDERLQLLYPVSGVEGSITFKRTFKSLFLIGSNRRPLALIGTEETNNARMEIGILWRPDGIPLQLDHSKTFLTQAYRLRGGTWNTEHCEVEQDGPPPTIRMRNRRGSSHEGYFEVFQDRVTQLSGQIQSAGEELGNFGETETSS